MTAAPGQRYSSATRFTVVAVAPGADQAGAAVRCLTELLRQGEDAHLVTKRTVFRRHLRALLPFGLTKDEVLPFSTYTQRLWTSVLGTTLVHLDEYELDFWEFRRQVVLARTGRRRDAGHLVVAQGQQVSIDFYSLIRLLGIPTTVLVDPASEVDESGAALEEICGALGVSEPSVLVLRDSRTTTQIHDFADFFRTGRSELACSRPVRDGPRPLIIQHDTVDDESKFIREHVLENPRARVGVLLPYADLVTVYREALAHILGTRVQWHLAGKEIPKDEQVDCRTPGVKVTTWLTAPGLEFDTTIIAGLDRADYAPHSARWRSTLQTLSTTARHELALSYVGHGEPVLLTSLPRHLVDDRTSSTEDVAKPPSLQPIRSPSASALELVRSYTQVERSEAHTPDSPVAAARRLLATDLYNPRNRRRVLTADEEVGLAQLMRGERTELSAELPRGFRSTLDTRSEPAAAFDALVTHNDGLVWSYVRTQWGNGLEEEDLYQHGVLGLMRAIEKFDANVGTKFSTYASGWIRQAVQRGIANERTAIRIPVHMYEAVRQVQTARNYLMGTRGHAPVAAISRICALKPEKVIECLRLAKGVVSLDAPLADDSGASIAELVPAARGEQTDPDFILDHEATIQLVHRALGSLTDREAAILGLRFGFDGGDERTLQEIGDKLGVTRERIRQIESKAKKRLAKQLAEMGLTVGRTSEAATTTSSVKPLRSPDLPNGLVRIHRSERDLASGTDLLGRLNSHRPVPDLGALICELVDQGLAGGAHTIEVLSSGPDALPWLAFAHDGEPAMEALLRAALVGSSANGQASILDTPDPSLRAAAAAVRLFDEVLLWSRWDSSGPAPCLKLTHAPRTDSWWLTEGTGHPPRDIAADSSPSHLTVMVLRAPRHHHAISNLDASYEALRLELGLTVGELLRANRTTLVIGGQETTPRDPFLWRNPASQDLGTEMVSANGHKALVNPRVLPHPTALREGDAYSVGAPAQWMNTQGFYVRSAGRYLSCGGWLGLDGLDCAQSTALARVAVDIDETERGAWGVGQPNQAVVPPDSLRPRLTALAELARRRSEQVVARQPAPSLTLGEPA